MEQQPQQLSAWVIPGVTSVKPPAFDDIVFIVTNYYNVSIDQIKKINRSRELVHARAMLCWFLMRNTNSTLKNIGRYFGQDHSTIIHHREKILGFIKIEDPQTLRDIEVIEKRIKLYSWTQN